MISGAYYYPIYLIAVTILTIIVVNRYCIVTSFPQSDNNLDLRWQALLLTVVLALFVGYRPVADNFGDTRNYETYYMMFNYGKPFAFKWNIESPLFDLITSILGSLKFHVEIVFLSMSFLYFGGLFLASRKLFPNDTMLALLVYLGAFSTFSYGVNGIRAGVAASMFLMAIAYKDHILLSLLLLLASMGFHHSMEAPIAIYLLAFVINSRSFFLFIWLTSLVIAALHITYFQEFFAGMTDEHAADYLVLNGKEKIISGFRPDFVLYSCIPIILGYYIIKKNEIQSEMYDLIWKIYTGTNAVFLLCTYASFNNRIAYLSWLLYPFVLIYPFLNSEIGDYQYRYLKYAVFGHLLFTIFMESIYYV